MVQAHCAIRKTLLRGRMNLSNPPHSVLRAAPGTEPGRATQRTTALALAQNLAPTAQRVLSTTVSSWTAPLVIHTRRTEVP